jgi:hypothetical protein
MRIGCRLLHAVQLPASFRSNLLCRAYPTRTLFRKERERDDTIPRKRSALVNTQAEGGATALHWTDALTRVQMPTAMKPTPATHARYVGLRY